MDHIPDSGFSLHSLPLFAIHTDLFTVCLSHMHCVKLFKLPLPSSPQAAWKELYFHTGGSVVWILLSFSSRFSPSLPFFISAHTCGLALMFLIRPHTHFLDQRQPECHHFLIRFPVGKQSSLTPRSDMHETCWRTPGAEKNTNDPVIRKTRHRNGNQLYNTGHLLLNSRLFEGTCVNCMSQCCDSPVLVFKTRWFLHSWQRRSLNHFLLTVLKFTPLLSRCRCF